jgi:hypothetical protein
MQVNAGVAALILIIIQILYQNNMNKLIIKQKRKTGKSKIIIILFAIILFATVFVFSNKKVIAQDSPGVLCKPFIYDFYGVNCPHCVNMKPTIKALKDAGYNVKEINANDPSNADYVRTYGVSGLPAFFVGYQVLALKRFQITSNIPAGETSSENLIQEY